ncbi:hypothetical protein [Paenibacillus sp. MBLB4367]|uniref:hypothetical protein n=1 Tax=Paenibacillus sp. MBLB4367 TaxID=3384767 RepID=UPI0039080884
MPTPIVNKPEETISLTITDFFVSQTIYSESPIDEYYKVTTEIIKLTDPNLLDDNPVLSQLIILGLVSAVEGYLRSIFCELLDKCPYARSNASSKQIRFGALDYYDFSRLAEALFDTGSFASHAETKSKTRELLGMTFNDTSSINVALLNFNSVCHLRHCAIHSGGTLNAHNAKELGLSKDYVSKKLQPNSVTLQDAIKICHSFVRAFNQYAFNETFKKWIPSPFRGEWIKEKRQFTQLINIFWSKIDNGPCEYNKVYRTSVPKLT